MNVDQAIRLVSAIGNFVGVLVWPVVVVFLVIRFRGPLSDFFSNVGEFSFKGLGLEAFARRRVEAAAAMGAAIATKAGDARQASSPSDVADALAVAVPNTRSQRRLQGRLVLWVDDQPANNRYERQALEALDVRTVISTSTDDALDQIRHHRFDLIISDMGRPPDPQAGYTLLESSRSEGDNTPFIIYAGSRSPAHVEEARRRGALGTTNSPDELIRMVTGALAGQ
jgi:CheY-like chemotaxis protein